MPVLNGADIDSGTAWELGYAYARNKTLLGVYEDTRVDNPDAGFNLMISACTPIFDSLEKLKTALMKIKT